MNKPMNLLDRYAHDYHGMAMTEEQLKIMLMAFVQEMKD